MRNAITVARPLSRKAPELPDRRSRRFRASYAETAHDSKRLRQINEFSAMYEMKKSKGTLLAFGLVLHSLLCVALFIFNVHIIALFSIGALLIVIQLVQCGFEVIEEGTRTQRAYHVYLGSLPLHDLVRLRKTETLSTWSLYEIDRYLETVL